MSIEEETKEKLLELCKQYIHWSLVVYELGMSWTAEQQRIKIHNEMEDLLGLRRRSLSKILWNALPSTIDPEKCEREMNIYGKKLYEKIIEEVIKWENI